MFRKEVGMRKAFIFLYVGTFLCVAVIVLLLINGITGFITSCIPSGASAAAVFTLIIALCQFYRTGRRLKEAMK